MFIGGLSIVLFIIIFSVLILIHEIGHFIVARLTKMEVEEFGIGIPPKVKTLFKWQGTDFTLNALPLGGFVRLKGENDPGDKGPGGYFTSSPWARLSMLAAGPFMNILAGVVAYIILFALAGIPDINTVVVAEVSPQSPALQAGFEINDQFLRVNGNPVNGIDEVREIIAERLDKPTDITVLRNGQEIDLSITPSSTRTAEEGAMGILLSNPIEKTSLSDAIIYGTTATGIHMYTLVTLPAQIISGAIAPENGRLIGFKGIYDFTYQSVQRDLETRQSPVASTGSDTTPKTSADSPTYYTISLIITLTLSLGVFNLLPIPALDGGRIVFLLPELIFRRRVPPNVETALHGIGFMLLIGLMLYINLMDFINPANIQLP